MRRGVPGAANRVVEERKRFFRCVESRLYFEQSEYNFVIVATVTVTT